MDWRGTRMGMGMGEEQDTAKKLLGTMWYGVVMVRREDRRKRGL
jgi:hypothetical protein